MAKFCVHCGSQIEEGAVCDCTSQQGAKVETTATTEDKQGTVNVNVDVNKVVNQGLSSVIAAKNITVKMVAKPVTTFTEVIKTPNFSVGVTFILAYALIWGLIAMSMVKKMLETTGGLLGGMLGEFGMYGFANQITELIPSSKVFFFGFFAIIIQAAAVIGLLLLANSLLKGNAKYQSITTMVGVSFAPSIIFTIIGLIASFISLNLTYGALIIGGVLSLILLYIGTKDVLRIDADRAAYLVPVINIITVIITWFYIKRSVASIFEGLMNSNTFGW
ncbi:YIP1 family protein [Alkaliphilus serpentinus]|uniref:YIP1 family protein n=1 Tax=Alkaliphilus serpentinus TaxID=1482731 RepID=A0A833M7Y4_9FIRM|nr:YIP1 family protein [Alkaliphilus serpentinus]KAB3529682.1 YIP1 family protein [Alkaliphilus serpentinus]